MKNIKKPNLIIIGAAKCGTTTLASILDEHLDVCMSTPKEVCFFQDTIDFKPNPNYEKGWEWYKKAFGHFRGEAIVGEATPSYTDRTRSSKTAQRIYEFNPEMRLIYMVRNPIQRQISAWKMQYAASEILDSKSKDWKIEYGWAARGFEYWLKNQYEVKQWDVNRYNFQLNAYREFFSKDKIHVTFLEDWKHNQKEEVNKVLQFLDLEENLTEVAILKKENTGERTYDAFGSFKRTLSNFGLNKLIPSGIRKQLSAQTIKEIAYPEINYNSDILREFKDFIKGDAEEFLNYNNKTKEFWSL
ncbi:sulfotransferase family protein [Mangrovimonas xylaniphaga]|uniref:sulfotransferase family protein n=1 Tax=Mangrovimonas xylaniphaga TaxID=1645915 RepID=UPI0006B55910|nr:sulfotransferase domain-containing protein [Mangrovimonas xylaniphaga]